MPYNNRTTTNNTLSPLGTPMSAKRYFESNNDDEFNRRRAHRRFESDRRERERKENSKTVALIVLFAIIAIVWMAVSNSIMMNGLDKFEKSYSNEEWQELSEEYYRAHPEQF